jgi:hypothetical protein
MRTTFMNALIHPIHILTFAAAVLSGLLSAWWLFPVGVLIWGVMVVGYVNDPSQRLNQKMEDRQPLATRFDGPFKQIERIQVRVHNNISAWPVKTRKELQPILFSMNMLVDEVYRLCLKMTPLENYRKVSNTASNLEAELKLLDHQIERAVDERAKKTYEEARESLLVRIEQARNTNAQLDRVEAFLATVVNDMSSIFTQIVSLQSMRPDDVKTQAQLIETRLKQEISEVQVFDTA